MSTANEAECSDFEARINEIYAEYSAQFFVASDQETAAIYVRVSAGGTASLEAQLHSALSHAAKEGMSVQREHIYHDRSCGNQEVRQGLQALQRLLDQGTVKIVIVFSLNRLFRNHGQMQEFLDAYGDKLAVRFIQVSSGKDSSASVEQQDALIRKIFVMSSSGMSLAEIVATLNNNAE